MNQESSQSYLDLSVLPGLRNAVLSARPTVVFAEEFDSIVWANAAGARLFGGTGVADLLALNLPPNNPVLRQLQHAVDQMEDVQKIVRGIRLSGSLRSQMLQFEIERIELLANSSGIKITQLVDEDDVSESELELCRLAVNSLEGFADAAAVVDDYGLPVFCSSIFADLGPDDAELTELIVELRTENDRLIKRPLETAAGEIAAVGLARLSDNPGRNLIVIARVADKDQTLPSTGRTEGQHPAEDDFVLQHADLSQISETDPVQNNDQQENDHNFDETPVIESEAETGFDDFVDEQVPEDSEPAITDEAEGQSDGTEEIPYTDHHLDIPDMAPQEDEPVLSAEDEPEIDSQPEDSFVESDAGTEAPESNETFIRFAWSVDHTGTFISVSDELAEFVGPNPANIVGRKWADISKIMGFDREREIEKLLMERDTWSGKSVLWPVEGTSMVVPVELAALPIFTTERKFEGFRGYGKIATGRMQEDPESLGLAFSNVPGASSGTEDGQSVAIDETTINEEPEIQLANPDTPDDSSQYDRVSSNIVPFSRTKEHDSEKSLTAGERDALEAVREHLQEHRSGEVEDTIDRTLSKNVDTSLLEKLPLAVLVFRNDETLFANRHLLKVTGYGSQRELIEAGGVTALIGHEDEHDDKRYQILLAKDGNKITVNSVLQSVPWDGEKALLLSFTPPNDMTPDILELTRVSEVQNILDTTTDGIILLDGEGKIISINAPAEALFGIDFDAAVDQELGFLFAEESQTTIRNYLDSIITSRFESFINDGEEAIAKESGGGMIPVFLTIAKMEQNGKLCAVIRDITNWKKAEEELIQSKQHAERANEQKSEFLAQVSHEIRTPLNAIIGFSDVMIEERFGAIENDRYREYLRDIRRSGVHVLDIINELLDLSKVESGKLDLTFEAVNLNELVAETVALLQPQANTNRTIIRTSLSRSVPKVVADPRSVRQIILNLVSNAIKYSEANSQVIVSTVYENNGEVALRVRDTGKGMTATEIEWAMKPFTQVHSISENNPEGTGLGLPLTKALVEANRAFFELESSPGNGTIAHVQFPMQRVLAD